MKLSPRQVRGLKIGGGVVGALILILLVTFGPIVRAQARSQAERRGAELEIGSVRPGWGRVWLRNLAVRVPEIPALTVEVDALEVGLSAGFGVKRVVAHGGRVVIRGEPAEVARQISEWRARHTKGSSGRKMAVAAEGLRVEWFDAIPGGDPQHAWGVRFERDEERERVSADLARVRAGDVAVELGGARVEVVRRDGKRALERFSTESLAAELDLDSDAMKDVLGRAAPEAPSNEAASGKAAQNGKPNPAAKNERPWDFSRFIDPERGPALRKRLGRATTIAADTLPDSGELDLSGVRLRLRHRGDTLNIGPARFRVSKTGSALSVELITAPTAEHALKLGLALPTGEGEVTANVEGGPVSLAALGVQEGDFGLLAVDQAKLDARGTATLSTDGKTLSWSGLVKLSDTSLQKKWLAAQPVKKIGFSVHGKGAAELDGSRVRIDQADLEIGKVRVELKGIFEQDKAHQKIDFDASVPLASCQAMLDSAPEGLLPLLAGTRVAGTFAFAGRLQVDSRQIEKMVAKWQVANDCRITDTSAEISPRKFFATFSRRVLDAEGKPTNIQSGPGSMGWTSRDAISKHMETAVLICEDGAFLRHRGFDEEAIRNSIRENFKASRFVRGASTISMQTAKNLYLSREKTLSRKLQEAVLTQLLEQELTKDQIMELYLNVIEFGPGIYGIGPAANYYFNSTPGRLSLGQSLYLASILSNPKRQYFGADGAVTPGWMGYLRKLMHIASKIRRVTDEELQDALTEQVTFKTPYSPRIASDDRPGEEPDGAALESEHRSNE